MQFQQITQKSQSSKIWLIRSKDDSGRACYFYILMDATKLPLLKKMQKGAAITPANLGTVILSGFGENPPPETAARMKEEYGFEE